MTTKQKATSVEVESLETKAIAAIHSAIGLIGQAQGELEDFGPNSSNLVRRTLALYQEVGPELEKISERLTGKLIGKAIGVRKLAS
jgi:hypothetical protein